jgi:hypothetical protein
MCFFDQYQFACGDYKWSHFRQHCAKEYRTGETCGMRLVMTTVPVPDNCKLCKKIEIKWGRIQKEQERIKRWKKENGKSRKHSIEASEQNVAELEDQIAQLQWERSQAAISL